MKIFFCILFCFFSATAQAMLLKSTFEARGANMALLTAEMQINLSENTYQIQTHSVTKGILSLLISSETTFKSQGIISSKKIEVTDFLMQNKSKGKIEKKSISFQNKPDYLDYQSTLIALMQQPRTQEKIFYLSDGKRDMRVLIKDEGDIDMATIHPSLNGQGEAYSIMIDVIAGKEKGWFFKRMKEASSSPLKLYLQKSHKTHQKELVLGTFDTGILGTLYIIRQEKIE